MTNVVRFRTLPIYWEKEEDGSKSNTVREVPSCYDERFEILRGWVKGDDLTIEIAEVGSSRVFQRKVSDVTFWKNLCVISWVHDETGTPASLGGRSPGALYIPKKGDKA